MSLAPVVLKKAFFSVFNRRFFILVTISLLVAALLLSSLAFIIGFGAIHIIQPLLPPSSDWAQKTLTWLAAGGSMFIASLLFPSFIPLIASLFEERVATDIEKLNYPAANVTHPLSLRPAVLHGLYFSTKMLLLNLILLPLYFIPVVNFFAYCPLNAYLLARDRFEVVALRYTTPAESKALFKKNRLRLWVVGGVLLIFGYLPFIKLLAPFISIAIMVHSFHEITKK
jgi:CysZ protein